MFSEVLSESTWDNVLTEAERVRLEALLPLTKGDNPQPDRDMLKYVQTHAHACSDSISTNTCNIEHSVVCMSC